MKLECTEIDNKKSYTLPPRRYLFDNAFIIGFAATIISSVAALYIFNNYLINRAASAAVEKYAQKALPSVQPIQFIPQYPIQYPIY